MASKRTWQSLSPAYRERLQKSGYSAKDYAAGKSRASARGHAQTPERPSQARKNPTRYVQYNIKKNARYAAARAYLIDTVAPKANNPSEAVREFGNLDQDQTIGLALGLEAMGNAHRRGAKPGTQTGFWQAIADEYDDISPENLRYHG